jgi:hypothetical protein
MSPTKTSPSILVDTYRARIVTQITGRDAVLVKIKASLGPAELSTSGRAHDTCVVLAPKPQVSTESPGIQDMLPKRRQAYENVQEKPTSVTRTPEASTPFPTLPPHS